MQARAGTSCPSVPAPIRDIDAVDYHVGDAGVLIDPALRSQNDAALEPARTFVRLVSASADHFVAEGKSPAGLCALANLRLWAEGEALLGTMANMQAERERAGLLSGLAFAYLKTKDLASSSDRAMIEPWLDRLARGVEFELPRSRAPGKPKARARRSCNRGGRCRDQKWRSLAVRRRGL